MNYSHSSFAGNREISRVFNIIYESSCCFSILTFLLRLSFKNVFLFDTFKYDVY